MAPKNVLVIDDSPTILKVVQLVLTKAGFMVSTAADGDVGLTLARERRPDLILLDFVMPKMNGYQVCRALADDESLREVPVVLMSAKGDQVGERFVKVMGIVDYITKPFSPEAITAVVQHTVSKYAKDSVTGRVPLLSARDLMDVDLDRGDAPVEAAPALAGVEAPAGEGRLVQVREALAAALGPRLAALGLTVAGEAGAGADKLSHLVAGALDDAMLAAVAAASAPGAAAAAAATGEGPGPTSSTALAGDLAVVPIAEVLQLLQASAQSGILTVTRGSARVDICFRSGRVDFAVATSLGDEFLLGRFVVDLQLMGQADLDAFLKSRTPGKLLGGQLVKLGYISESDLKQVLTKQTSELVYEVLRWRFGSFSLRATRDLPPTAVEASLALEVDGILMEGFRRVDEWHLIEREIESFDLVFLRNEDAVAQMGRSRLTREELAVLELVNGKNTVKEIVRQARMGSFEVSKILYRLLSVKLLRRRVLPVAV